MPHAAPDGVLCRLHTHTSPLRGWGCNVVCVCVGEGGCLCASCHIFRASCHTLSDVRRDERSPRTPVPQSPVYSRRACFCQGDGAFTFLRHLVCCRCCGRVTTVTKKPYHADVEGGGQWRHVVLPRTAGVCMDRKPGKWKTVHGP